ncbi:MULTISPECIES: replication initiation protein [Enterococcus]|jgi:plasmid replication initiation protein|nr:MULTISPECIES: replication initiation protein [Enterococcus]EPH67317.1 initiator RepB protein [Enterococcus faecium 13.SD.W.09]MEB6088237.1 replication initiation protein [Enterococcus casseliflavus]MEB8401733.1 replication initiation protein [Enterococcus casseliflavus]
MANELIKYDAELNTIPLKHFSPVEMNLFFSIVSRMRDKEDQVVRFSFDQLKELSNYKPTANKRFLDDIQDTYQKLLGLAFSKVSKSGKRRQMFVMFTQFDINGEDDIPYVDVQVHEMALPLLNNLDTWVRYSLTEFRELKSGYAKTAFRLLKQFRTQGWAEFTREDFFELMDIPKSYQKNLGEIDRTVLKPIKEELTPLFKGLTIRKKYGKGRGKPVIGYRFTWKAEKNDEDHFSKGKQAELRTKLFNIEHNGELTQEEKWRAKDRALGLRLGTHEADAKAHLAAELRHQQEQLNQQALLGDLSTMFE